MNKFRWQQALGVILPLLGIVIEIWDSVNQSNLQLQEMKEFEETLVKKYGLEEIENED